MRFLWSPTLRTRLGHLAIEPYYVVKEQRAGYLTETFALRHTASVNPCLFNYWASFFPLEPDRPGLDQLERTPGHMLNCYPNDITAGPWTGIPAQEVLQRASPGGVLELTDAHRAEGARIINRCLPGSVPGFLQPWVCLHVRDDGFFGKNMPYHRYRNADIDTYALACDELVGRGYLVCVMGCPNSKPFSRPGVFDYAHSAIRSDRMDIYLLGGCEFFLGTASGPMAVATAFGRPCVATNKAPMNSGPDTEQDLFVPKRYRKDGRFLTLEEIMASQVRNFDHAEMFTDAGLEVVDNTPEEIRDAVLEMLANQPETTGQQQFRALCQRDPQNRSLSRIGAAFVEEWVYA